MQAGSDPERTPQPPPPDPSVLDRAADHVDAHLRLYRWAAAATSAALVAAALWMLRRRPLFVTAGSLDELQALATPPRSAWVQLHSLDPTPAAHSQSHPLQLTVQPVSRFARWCLPGRRWSGPPLAVVPWALHADDAVEAAQVRGTLALALQQRPNTYLRLQVFQVVGASSDTGTMSASASPSYALCRLTAKPHWYSRAQDLSRLPLQQGNCSADHELYRHPAAQHAPWRGWLDELARVEHTAIAQRRGRWQVSADLAASSAREKFLEWLRRTAS